MTGITPFVYLQRTGWVPNLIADKAIDFGTRFDAGIGYRVFFKYAESDDINAFPAAMAHGIAAKVKMMPQPVYKELAKNLTLAAENAEKMNNLWAAAGCPDEPVDVIKESGHA